MYAGGLSWSFNTALYIQDQYDDYDGLFLALDSIIGGSFGVFFGGWFSDWAVKRFGMHSRLWILSVCIVSYHGVLGCLWGVLK